MKFEGELPRRRYTLVSQPEPATTQRNAVVALYALAGKEPETEEMPDDPVIEPAVTPEPSPAPAASATKTAPAPAPALTPIAAPAPAAEPPADAPTANKPSEKPDKPAARKVRMTPEQAEWFLSDPECMALYLRFGAEAYGKTREEKDTLKSQGTDWLAHKPEDWTNPFTKEWTQPQYGAYFWYGVCRWRAAHGIALTFPSWGRLMGEVRNLLKTTTPWQAYLHLRRVVENFDVIRFLIGRLGEGFVLDEGSLNHPLVKQKSLLIDGHGQPWLEDQIERMRSGQAPDNFSEE